MEMHQATRHTGRRHFAGWLTTILVAIGSAVLVLVAFATADERAPAQHAVPATQEFNTEVGAIDTASELDEGHSTADHIPRDSNDRFGNQMSQPRECRPDQGIATDCTFD